MSSVDPEKALADIQRSYPYLQRAAETGAMHTVLFLSSAAVGVKPPTEKKPEES